MRHKLWILIIPAIFLVTFIMGCGAQSYDDGYKAGFQEGYTRGYQEVLEKDSSSDQIQTPSAPQEVTETRRKLTLADASDLLNLLPLLPMTYEKVDAASEGMSNADLGLGPDFSEVQLFLSDEPFQMIYGMFALSESRIERAGFDAMMKDEPQIRNLIMESIKQGAIEEGIDFQNPEIQITYPAIGDLAILGEGYFSSFGFTVGFDTLWFRSDNAYVFLYSSYYSLERKELLPLAKQLEQRLAQYSY